MGVSIDMKKLAGLVRELEDQLSACTRCGMCQAVCLLYRLSGSDQQQRFRCGGGQGGRWKIEGIPAGVFQVELV